jgi:hypothetical protein
MMMRLNSRESLRAPAHTHLTSSHKMLLAESEASNSLQWLSNTLMDGEILAYFAKCKS